MGIGWRSGIVADELMPPFVLLERAGDAMVNAVHPDMLHTLPGGARKATGLDSRDACLNRGPAREEDNA
jgi:hypothetical protein